VNISRFCCIALLVGSLVLFLTGCLGKAVSPPGNQIATVQRGNLTIDITGAGNLALSQTQDLAFEMAGYVEEVLVKEGESVKEGQIIAKLGTAEWDKQLKTLEKTVSSVQRTQTTRERALATAQRQVAAKELSVRSAELDLQAAQDNQDNIAEVKRVQDDIDNAQDDLDMAVAVLHGNVAGVMTSQTYWESVRSDATARLAQLKKNLQNILAGNDVTVSSDIALQVARSQLQLKQSQRQLEEARIAVEEANLAVEDARLNKEDAEQDVKDAQSDLDDAESRSPIIKAPFAGIINKVNVKGGDEIFKGAVAVQLADPGKFTADIVVGESDIIKVKEGGSATIKLDAIPNLTLQAKVFHISPSATIQSGVVNYKVTVEMETLKSTANPGQAISPELSDNVQPLPVPALGQTSSQPNPGQNSQRPTISPRTSPTSAQASQTNQIRAGMSVTVSIAVAESRGVLLVPNQAITYNGRTSQVQVLKDGVAETRTVRTGINNWQYTEITEGLSEGDQLVISATAATSTPRSTPSSNQRGGQQAPIMIPGGAR
jgi:HlyD family secretion protein